MHSSDIRDPNNRPKYDAEALRVMQVTKARSVLLLVFGGKKGDGVAHKIEATGNVAADAEHLRVSARILQRVAADLLAAADAQHLGDFFEVAPEDEPS